MPVQYQSVLAEHRAVRSSAGWFDVTHLGRFALTGRGAETALLRLLSNEITRIAPGQTQYTLLLNEDGGIIDDLVVWWWGDHDFWVFPNAANHDRVMGVFSGEPDCDVRDLRSETILVAVQGPDAPGIIEAVLGTTPKRFRTAHVTEGSAPVWMAGTGYTGERGGEICADPGAGRRLVERIAGAGAVPCGLAARDTLRLEAGLPLWGADIDESTTPFEAGLDFAVVMDRDFVGCRALEGRSTPERLLVGFILEERGIPRHGYRVRTSNGNGTVTSGNLSPVLDTGIGLAYLTPPPEDDARIEIEIRDRWVPGRVAEPPFHKG